MRLTYTEDQQMLAETIGRFGSENSPVGRVRELRDASDSVGFSRALWKQLAELGFVGLTLPERFGGAEMAFADLCIILEHAGRTLMPEPFLSTLLLGAQTLVEGGNEEQQSAWLPGVCSGDKLLAVAYQEAGSRYDLGRIEASATRTADGYSLSGTKIQVLDGHVADALIVSANTDDGATLFLVESGAAGLKITPQTRIDGRNAALVALDGVSVREGAVVGQLGDGLAVLDAVVDRATVGLCAEMVGAASQAFDDTLNYLKERVQFDRPIGSFQALQHRAARLFVELSLARAATMAAARDVTRASASLAKVKAGDAFVHITNEAVQMHGGVGMTDEYDIGFYMKRARACAATFGDSAYHRDRWATLKGY